MSPAPLSLCDALVACSPPSRSSNPLPLTNTPPSALLSSLSMARCPLASSLSSSLCPMTNTDDYEGDSFSSLAYAQSFMYHQSGAELGLLALSPPKALYYRSKW
eukprot:TRINITY_DN390_c1_g2_i1.p1 TRINITY_DN390_c1_g2~~TRINITY_DN390_c1_g2_i1.p1  ORF type:complete len:116 (+),score=38.41 TRINITY_DN390_c1_g2_i1:38-349(+)